MTATDPARLFRLDGRTAFISGGAGHLGEAMVRAMAAHGARVVVNGRNPERLAAFQSTLADDGAAIETACFDMMDFDAVRGFFATLPRLDILINNAVTVKPGKLETQTPDEFDVAYRSSVVSAFEAMRSAEAALTNAVSQNGHAAVINIATMYAHVSPDPKIYGESGLNSPPAYGPAKAGLVQLTRHMAAHWGMKGIRVNSVSPGPFPNPGIATAKPAFATRLAEKTALGRIGQPDEIAGAVIFLGSDAGRFVTGTDIAVDGGWRAW